ncbi:MAG: Pla-1/cef family extracellular lipase [Paraglaciecola sp.]|jgi:Pla-1/cef family extracellular lipase
MKKRLLGAGMGAFLGLTGCGGGDTIEDLQQTTPVVKPFVRIVFDPANSDLNIPNDFLMIPKDGDIFDFTINTVSDAEFSPGNPEHALSAIDGWSTHHPFQIRVILPDGNDIDPNSLAPGAIRIFEATQALEGSDPVCQTIAAESAAPGLPCVLGDELQYGVDFVTAYTSGSGAISVVPLKPMKANQGHMLVVTEELKDTQGSPVRGSTTWDLVRQDINTLPLSSADQLQLQGLVNILLDVLAPVGLVAEDVSYAAYFSTQSAGTVLSTVKQLQVGPFAQALQGALANGLDLASAQQFAAQYLPLIPISEGVAPDVFSLLAPTLLGDNLAGLAALGLDSCGGLMAGLQSSDPLIQGTAAATFAQVAPFCAANLKQGSIDLAYYSSPTAPLGDWWRAACTNGAMLQVLGAETIGGLIAGGAVGANNALCQAASGGQLFDLDLSGLGIQDLRNLTKVSPVPASQGSNVDNPETLYNEAGTESLTVQITVPNETVIAVLASIPDSGVTVKTKPEAGWPVVILQHGITSKKEDMLLLTGPLALAGYATVAIDHPLHGSRGFVIDGTIVNTSGGFGGGGATDYLNLANLLATRDNGRQSVADIMGLRLGLNATVDLTGGSADLDGTDVSFVGHSLGAITGTVAVALSNQTLGGDLAAFDAMYSVQAATLANPGGGQSGFLLESGSFGNLIKGSLLAGSSAAFVEALTAYMVANSIPEATSAVLAEFYPLFEAGLNPEQLAVVNSTFASFAFAAQTVTDAGDPNNYAALIGANTSVHMMEQVGGGINDNGETALPDQTIPNTTSLPLAGTEPLAALIGLQGVSSTTEGEGLVRFIAGGHSSLINPTISFATTVEMQTQTAAFIASKGALILISDPSLVQ